MAEETQIQEPTEQAEPQGEAKPETDWKAEARKWEARAKKSAQAELELEALKQAQMTEQEKEKARADKAEQELAALRAENQRMADAAEIAARDGIPQSLLAYCADREAMERFATDYKAAQPTIPAAAPMAGVRITSGDAKPTNGELFAAAVSDLF